MGSALVRFSDAVFYLLDLGLTAWNTWLACRSTYYQNILLITHNKNLHEIFNVLSQHAIFTFQLQVLFLHLAILKWCSDEHYSVDTNPTLSTLCVRSSRVFCNSSTCTVKTVGFIHNLFLRVDKNAELGLSEKDANGITWDMSLAFSSCSSGEKSGSKDILIVQNWLGAQKRIVQN